MSSRLASPSPSFPSGAIGQIYDLLVTISPAHQLAAARDAVITVAFSLPVPLPPSKDINIWVPANFIESFNQARHFHPTAFRLCFTLTWTQGVTPDKFVCGTGGWCLSPATFAFKTPSLPLTSNLGKHDFIIIQTKTAVPAGAVTITVSGLTMGAITLRKDDGFKVSSWIE